MKLKARSSFRRLSDGSFVSRLNAIHDAMAGNPAYPNPPVNLADFKTAIIDYGASIVTALDGGKQAVAEKRKRRDLVVKMVEQLAHYVEANCNDDAATFTSSGFEFRSGVRVPPQPVDQPSIVRIDQGQTGQLLVNVTRVPKARVYEIRYGPPGSGTSPAPWPSITVGSARKATPVNNLTPGTTYAFQVRAYGNLGFTDWSRPVERMCI